MEGLWEFPMAEAGAEPDLERRISEELAMTHGALGGLRRIATLRHNITRHRIRIVVFEAFLRGDAAARRSSARSLDRARPARWRRSGKSAAADSAATDLAGTLSTGRGRWIVSHQLASLPLTGIARKIVRACAGLGTEEGESAPAPEDAITRVMRGGEA
jgi:hypothetical protein